MPWGPAISRFRDLRASDLPPEQPSDFVRLPDGSLVMTGTRPMQQPGMLDRLRAAASQIIPAGMFGRSAEPAPPWWIAQPQAAPVPVAAATTTTNAPSRPSQGGDWDTIARESAHEQAIADQLGDFSKRVMASPELIQGKWFGK